jgi:glutamine synthetase
MYTKLTDAAMKAFTEMNPNPLVQYLNKPAEEFTREDIIKYAEDHNIEMVNFRYVGWDGRLKTLNFIINNRQHLETILTMGERVDGSSLFSFIEAGSSDLYVIPKYRTAFLNPFTEIPAIDIVCSYFNKDGEPLESSPEYILKKADKALKEKTGYELQAMGELEYYVISRKEDLYHAVDQRGYHESSPFTKWEHLRTEAMQAIAQAGGQIKYGHSEVGNFEVGDLMYEQNEIEFLPCPIESAAEQLLIAKWILRTLAYKYGVTVSFAPKITVGKAGSGLHIHTRLMKDGKNVMIEKGKLSDTAKRMIAGFLDVSPSLTSFGNINPTSYFRLVPHQEAPTNICWGDRNRSVLVRVPLGWTGNVNMVHMANPLEEAPENNFYEKQTVEYRGADGTADIYLLMAGLAVAALHGLEMKDGLNYAERTYVDVNIFKEEHKERVKGLSQLPTSCWESAEALEKQKPIYLKYKIFSEGMIDWIIRYLKSFEDRNFRRDIGKNEEEIMKVVQQYFHCG